MPDVTRPNEISLFGNFYPIVGNVKKSLVSQWPQKQIIGDFTKDSEKIVSSWVINDQSEGIGVKEMDETKHSKRCFQSELNTDYPGHLFMNFLSNLAGAPVTNTESTTLIEFNNGQYVVDSALGVRLWNNTTSAWGASLVTLGGTPTDAIVHKGKLYFAYGTDFIRFDGIITWLSGKTLSGTERLARYFVEWDDKLFYVTNAGALFWSADEGVTWTANTTSTMPSGSFTSLFKYRDDTGAIVIYLGTTTGIKILDYDAAQWMDTELNFPENSNACKCACVWRGDAYIPCGLTVYKYSVTSSGAVITPMGPGDTDYGLDSDYQGSIVRLLPELNHLYAIVRRSASPKYSYVLKYNGKGWGGCLLIVSSTMEAGCLSTADSIYRIWFATGGNVIYYNLPNDIYNALELPLASYPLNFYDSDHITPWFDSNVATINKTALRGNMSVVLKYAEAVSNKITVSYGLNHDDATWTSLGTATSTTAGENTLLFSWDFGSGAGIAFKAIRFRFRFNSDDLTAHEATPDMHWFKLEYVKNIEAQWGFDVTVDCLSDYRHKRASTLEANLKTAAETQTLGVFVYRTFQETSETYYVRITDMKGVTKAGRVKEGLYNLKLVAV